MEDEIDLLEQLNKIIVYWKLVVLVAVVFFVVGYFNSAKQPNMFKASTTLMLVDNSSGGLGGGSVFFNSNNIFGRGGSEEKLLVLLQSYSLAIEVAKTLSPQVYFSEIFKNNKISSEQKLPAYASWVRGAVIGKNSDGLITITAVWDDPQKAADLANLYVEQLGVLINSRALNINFQIIDPAVKPAGKFKPNPKKDGMIGLVFGLFCGVIIAFILEFLKQITRRRRL